MGQVLKSCYVKEDSPYQDEWKQLNNKSQSVHYSRNSVEECISNADRGSDDEEQSIQIKSDAHFEEDLKVGLNDFIILKTIGKGSFGTVMLVEKKQTNNLYAMKIIEKIDIEKKDQRAYTQSERMILQTTDHPFAIKLYYAFQTSHKLYLVMDFQQGGELYFHIRRAYRFEERIVQFIAAELVLVLDHLHRKNIIYRDLKPENILIGSDGHIKIADFGLSKIDIKQGQLTHSIVGTPEYLAPEIYMEQGHTHMCDWWSLGAVIYEMLNGEPPFYSKDKKLMFRNRNEKQVEIKPWFSESSAQIVLGLLQNDPRERLGYNDVREIKNCKFFKDIDWDALFNKQIASPLQVQLSSPQDVKYFNKRFTELPLKNEQNKTELSTPEPYKGFSYEIDDSSLMRSK